MKGFLISVLFNLIFHIELLILAVFAWLAHIIFGLTIVVALVLLGLWILVAVLITAGLGVLSRGAPPPKFQKNANLYSKTTRDFTEMAASNDADSENST